MRISDWSSDVCSSDLGVNSACQLASALDLICAFFALGKVPCEMQAVLHNLNTALCRPHTLASQPKVARRTAVPCVELLRTTRCVQIGRASCRERVCQYV